MKSNHLGINSNDFYLQFAKMELVAGNINKAESVLKNGLEVLKNNSQLLSALHSLETLGSFSCPSKLPQNNPVGSINFGLLTPASMENNSQDSFAKPTNRVKRFGLVGPPKRINNLDEASPSKGNNSLIDEAPTPATPIIRNSFPSQLPEMSPIRKIPAKKDTDQTRLILNVPAPSPRIIVPIQNEMKSIAKASPLPQKSQNLTNYPNEDEETNMSLTGAVINTEKILIEKHPIAATNSTTSTTKTFKTLRLGSKSYRILQMIGKGGSSKVYRVLSQHDNQIYALKKVSLKNLDEITLNGYINEIDLLEKFKNQNSPFIIKLIDHEIHREQGSISLLMECGESDLCRMLQEKKPSSGIVDYNFIRYYFAQMVQAVRVVHEAKVVHCDLKPANFLLVQGHLKLIDFGISKAILNNDTTNVLRENQVGTVNYMSPEALQETSTLSSHSNDKVLKIGRPSDMWSLGCILFEMAFGRPPFAHLTLVQRLQRIMDPAVPIEYPPCDNSDLVDCIKGCLIRAPKLRYSLSQLENHPFLKPPAAHKPEDSVVVRREQIHELMKLVSEKCPGIDPKHISDRIFEQWSRNS
jgi:serine/threonine-protein kinase TTK/MPS1